MILDELIFSLFLFKVESFSLLNLLCTKISQSQSKVKLNKYFLFPSEKKSTASVQSLKFNLPLLPYCLNLDKISLLENDWSLRVIIFNWILFKMFWKLFPVIMGSKLMSFYDYVGCNWINVWVATGYKWSIFSCSYPKLCVFLG